MQEFKTRKSKVLAQNMTAARVLVVGADGQELVMDAATFDALFKPAPTTPAPKGNGKDDGKDDGKDEPKDG